MKKCTRIDFSIRMVFYRCCCCCCILRFRVRIAWNFVYSFIFHIVWIVVYMCVCVLVSVHLLSSSIPNMFTMPMECMYERQREKRKKKHSLHYCIIPDLFVCLFSHLNGFLCLGTGAEWLFLFNAWIFSLNARAGFLLFCHCMLFFIFTIW